MRDFPATYVKKSFPLVKCGTNLHTAARGVEVCTPGDSQLVSTQTLEIVTRQGEGVRVTKNAVLPSVALLMGEISQWKQRKKIAPKPESNPGNTHGRQVLDHRAMPVHRTISEKDPIQASR